jgi:molybdopterin-guanine dinucleotide biosynthesis protein A
MGRDKAFVDVRGRPLVSYPIAALRAAGAGEVLAVGGDRARLVATGAVWVPDRFPGEGPVGGIVTALGAAGADVVVVLACDMPNVTAEAVAFVVEGLAPGDDAAVAVTGGRLEPLLGAYRRRCAAALEAAFQRGERAVHAALAGVAVRHLPLPEPAWARSINTPAELAEVAAGPAGRVP